MAEPDDAATPSVREPAVAATPPPVPGPSQTPPVPEPAHVASPVREPADTAPSSSVPAAADRLTEAAWGGSGSAGLKVAPLTTLAVGLVCAVVAALRTGERGAVSALVATTLVALFFWSGLLPILLSRGQEDRAAMGLAVLLVNYTLRLALALLLLRGAERADLVDTRVLGVTIIVATLTWTGTQVALLGRRRPV